MAGEATRLHRPILGNVEYESALDAVLEKAERTIRIFDQTLRQEYNSPLRAELLRKFLLTSRRNHLQIVVHDPRPLDRNCPRMLNLLRAHSHAISIHETHASAKSVYDPFAVADDRHFVHRFHFDEMRGLLSLEDPIGAHSLNERFDEIWEASSPAVLATTLGL